MLNCTVGMKFRALYASLGSVVVSLIKAGGGTVHQEMVAYYSRVAHK
jgi:hypothetical protein